MRKNTYYPMPLSIIVFLAFLMTVAVGASVIMLSDFLRAQESSFSEPHWECVEWGVEDYYDEIYPQRIELTCHKDYVGCDPNNNKTWDNDVGCLVPLVKVSEYITYLPCGVCNYTDYKHYEMNIGYIWNYATLYDCTVREIYLPFQREVCTKQVWVREGAG